MKHNWLRIIYFILASILCSTVYAVELNELLENERNTIAIFKTSSPKVIYVHRMMTVINNSLERVHIPSGAGSGIIWDKDGHIVTNYHVVKGADNLAVSIGNRTFPAKVIGAEPRKDIAVLSLTSSKALELLETFIPFELAPTHELLVGQKAIAIGNPFGLDHSLTTGVISALGRRVPGVAGVTIHDMIQTDASINPGNSGGPLLDSRGRLIGLNTAIYSQSGSSSGVGFAVPADEISRLVTQIIKHGRVILAGIGIQRVEPNIAKPLGVEKGVLIADVLPNTPAADAGLIGTHRDRFGRIRLGDVIVAVNGHPTPDYDVLYNLLSGLKIGDEITVTVDRNGRRIQHKMKTIDIAAF